MATSIPSDETRSISPPNRSVARQLLPFGLMLLAHAPLLYVYFQQLWSRPHYQFFPLVMLAFCVLFAGRWPDRETPSRRAVLAAWVLLVGSAGLLALAIARLSPFVSYVSTVILVGALILRMGIPAWGPWLLLLTMIRIPYGQDVATIQAMQRITTDLSGTALDSIGVEHFVDGNVIEFPGRSLFVEEACSGVVSMLAMVACAAILAVWYRRSLVQGLLLMASGVFWAGAMNVIRVVGIAIALAWFDIDLTHGWRHDATGLAAFAVSLCALASTDRLLLFALDRIPVNPLSTYWMYAEENWLIRFWNKYAAANDDGPGHELYGEHADDWANPTDDQTQPPVTAATPGPPPPSRPWEWVLVPVFLLLGAVQVIAGIGPFSAAPAVRPLALELTSDDLPNELNGWEKVNFEEQVRDSSSAFGEHSRIWTYRKGSYVALLSLDFVFPEWHELTACYQGTGWEVESRSLIERGQTAVEAQFVKPNGESAYLIFDLFDSQGEKFVAPGGSFFHPQLRRIIKGETTRFTLPNYYQLQALVGLPGETLAPEARRDIQRLFETFEDHIKSRFTE